MRAKDIIITVLVALFFVILLFFFLFKSCEADSTERAKWESDSNEYYEKYKIVMKGKVIRKRIFDSRNAAFTIRIRTTNVKEHIVCEYNEDYYLIIKGDSAMMVDGPWSAEVGDSILVDYTTQKQVVWNQKTRHEDRLRVFSPVYRGFRKQGLGW